jgi:hypothetical protein
MLFNAQHITDSCCDFPQIQPCVFPLEIRRYGRIMNTNKRLRESSTMKNLENLANNVRLMGNRRRSFLEKLIQTKKILNLDQNRTKNLSKKELNKILKIEWSRIMNQTWKNEERQVCYKNIKSPSLRYIPISNNRKMNSTWHQARLGVIPTKAFLFSIGKKKDNKCPRCKVKDNINHMLSSCNRYRSIWTKRKMSRKPEEVSLGTFLGLDRPSPTKQRIARILQECSKWQN